MDQFLSGVQSTAMLYLFGSFSVLSDESTIDKCRGGISLLGLSEFVALRSSRSKRVPAFSRETTSVMLVHQTVRSNEFETLQLEILLNSLNILKRHDYFSLSLEGRWHIRNIRPQTDIVAGLKVSFFLFVVGDQRVRSYFGFYWV